MSYHFIFADYFEDISLAFHNAITLQFKCYSQLFIEFLHSKIKQRKKEINYSKKIQLLEQRNRRKFNCKSKSVESVFNLSVQSLANYGSDLNESSSLYFVYHF